MRRVIGFVAVAIALFGCSSSDDGGTPTVSAEQACTELSNALCDKLETCSALFVELQYGDVATCKTRAMIDCKAALAAPSTAATPADSSACAKAASSVSCAQLLDNQLPTECKPKSGGLDDGKACGNDSQCKSGFCGFDPDKKICGVCGPKPAEGGDCTDGACGSGLKCVSGKCVVPAAVGEACSDAKPCTTSASCVSGKCAANLTTEGAACDDTGKTTPSCDMLAGLLCLGGKCVKLTPAADGAECGITTEGSGASTTIKGVVFCEKGGWCSGVDPKSGAFKGTCKPAAADGQPCTVPATDDDAWMTGPGCLEPAECIDGTCRVPDATTCK